MLTNLCSNGFFGSQNSCRKSPFISSQYEAPVEMKERSNEKIFHQPKLVTKKVFKLSLRDYRIRSSDKGNSRKTSNFDLARNFAAKRQDQNKSLILTSLTQIDRINQTMILFRKSETDKIELGSQETSARNSKKLSLKDAKKNKSRSKEKKVREKNVGNSREKQNNFVESIVSQEFFEMDQSKSIKSQLEKEKNSSPQNFDYEFRSVVTSKFEKNLEKIKKLSLKRRK